MSSRSHSEPENAAGTASRADRRTVPRIGVISLGCSKNLVDTEVMLGHLDRAGYAFVLDSADADVIVVNTCGFIEAARQESIQTILEAAELKKTGRLQKLVVAGCMVQRYREELRDHLPEIDAFIDLDQLEQVVAQIGDVGGERTLGAASGPKSPPAAVTPSAPASELPVVSSGNGRSRHPAPVSVAGRSPASYLYDDATPRRRATPDWSAYLKIAEGCDHTCSFCAIPSFRGTFRSRSLDSVVREAKLLASQGVVEINLIAQDSSHYGRDLGLQHGLADLLSALNPVPGLRWIRVHYLYPNTITETLIDRMAALPQVVNYVDLPLQHADRATLRRMRRGGSANSHHALLAKFRVAIPDVTLRSTFIVGFPGETELEFETLLRFVGEARFDHVGVFTYSHEQGTHARTERDDVPEDVKQARRHRLMQLQQSIVLERNARRIGQRVLVLLEGAHPETEHLLVGRMAGQAPEVDGQILINDGTARPGSFVQVELTETAGYDLVGRIVGAA